jgi:hypothetical protein
LGPKNQKNNKAGWPMCIPPPIESTVRRIESEGAGVCGCRRVLLPIRGAWDRRRERRLRPPEAVAPPVCIVIAAIAGV